MKIDRRLVEEIAGGRTLLFAGAGLSARSGLPTWGDLLLHMIEWCGAQDSLMSTEDARELRTLAARDTAGMLTAAQDLRDRIGPQVFKELMEKTFRHPGHKPSRTVLATIPFRGIITTNYDKLLEATYSKVGEMPPPPYTQRNIPALATLTDSERFFILKVHGDIDDIDSVMLGRRDYRETMFASQAYRDTLEYLFQSRTVLFVGAGLNDPDLRLVLDEIRTAYRGHGRIHYAVLDVSRVGTIERKSFERDYGIKIIPIDLKGKEGGDLDAFLEDLQFTVAERLSSTRAEAGEGLRDVHRQEVEQREQERARLASEIHDGPLQQAIYLSKARLDPEQMVDMANKLARDLRAITTGLRPPALDDLGLYYALDFPARSANQEGGILVQLDDGEFAESLRLDHFVELALYRCAQEAMSNLRKHSHATKATLSLIADSSKVEIRLTDDGIGFDKQRRDQSLRDGHLGLITMRERMRQVGGSADVDSQVGRGTTVRLTVPLPPQGPSIAP